MGTPATQSSWEGTSHHSFLPNNQQSSNGDPKKARERYLSAEYLLHYIRQARANILYIMHKKLSKMCTYQFAGQRCVRVSFLADDGGFRYGFLEQKTFVFPCQRVVVQFKFRYNCKKGVLIVSKLSGYIWRGGAGGGGSFYSFYYWYLACHTISRSVCLYVQLTERVCEWVCVDLV